MIARRVPRRRDGKSSYGDLVRYLVNDKGKADRVGDVTITNCESDSAEWAIHEVEATQALNKRAKSDKTYHLMFSFREGEDIPSETLKLIEQELCEGLGYAEHQRVSVVHRDTDNLHVHVAINKIHPQTLNIIEPYYDHKRLGELAARLEVKYDLERDNHTAKRSATSDKADDLAAKTGMETLAEWVRSEVLPGITEAKDWQSLREHLAEHGLDIKKKGAGLVFVDQEGVTVRASSVDRGCSLQALQSRLGDYEESPDRPKVPPKKSYQFKPKAGKVSSKELFARHTQERGLATVLKRQSLADLQAEKKRAIEAVLQSGRTKRAAVKMLKGAGQLNRRLLYSQIHSSQARALKKINEEFTYKRGQIHKKQPLLSFVDWLKESAAKGDQEALNYLRAKGSRMRSNTVYGQAQTQSGLVNGLAVDGVSKSGAVTYRTQGETFRDDGNRLQLSKEAGDAVIAKALSVAASRHGSTLNIDGDSSFKTKVAQVAARLSLAVTFDDPKLEQLRRTLAAGDSSKKEAAGQYIRERNEKHAKGFDIMKHRHFASSDAGTLEFAGNRKVAGQSLALFKKGDEVVVLPVSEVAALQLKRQTIGRPLEVSISGDIKVAGTTRSRL